MPASAWREAVLGDLREEYADFARTRPGLVARLWYWSEAARLVARYAARAVAARRTAHRAARHVLDERTKGDSLVHLLWQDVRFAVRTLLRERGVALTIVLTLGLCLGANAAVFGVIDALIFRPYPIPMVDRIVMVAETSPTRSELQESVSPANYLDWKAQSDVFERLAAWEWWDVNLSGRDEPERVQGFFVTADFFRLIGAAPALGRDFLPDDEQVGQHTKVVLGYGLWQRRFAGDPSVVGHTILLDATPYTVIGIAPEGFDFPMTAEIWAPLAFDQKTAGLRSSRYLTVIGRLRPDRRLKEAQAQMQVIVERLERQYPESNRSRGARVVTLADGMIDEGSGAFLAAWQVAALFVLLIGCANVASLLLARGAAQHREMAVRLAMGASRRHLVRQLLVESALLAVAAVPVSILLARVALNLIRSGMPAHIARFVAGWREIGIDGRLVLVTSLLALATAVVFGVLPALHTSRPRLAESLKEGGRSATPGPGRHRLRQTLVVGQIALALTLLITTVISMASTMRHLYGPPGYAPDGLLALRVVLPDSRYAEAAPRRQFAARVLDELRSVPGSQRSAAISVLPSGGFNSSRAITIEGSLVTDRLNQPTVDYRTASAGYFDVMRIPISRGRPFGPQDTEQTLPVAIVSQTLADKFWPGQDPIGKRLKLSAEDSPWRTVVGVAGDVVHGWFQPTIHSLAYVPFPQAPPASFALVTRATGDPNALVPLARAAVRAVDPAQPVFDVMSMRRLVADRTIGLQYAANIMAALGALALTLAAVGIYGLMAYLVIERTHEIGVRVALGASRRDVLRLTGGQALRLTGLGVSAGLAFAVVISRLTAGMVPGMAPPHAWMLAAVALALAGVGLAAGYVPSRRALRIDPVVALRQE
jgi:putative ABC transport system permease protein